MQYTHFISQSLKDASFIAREYFNRVTGTTKRNDNNQVLTKTDIMIGKLLTEKIKKEYPDHNIIDEESGVADNHSDHTWIVDPIDGTSNFAAGLPTYGIMIGLLLEDTPIAGGIILPSFDELYIAEKGKGTFCNNQRVSVTDETNLMSQLVAYGIDSHPENPGKTRNETRILSDIILNIRNLRSSNSCYDPTMVAKGKYGAYLNQTQKIWDNVPQHIIIEEAGGKVTDFFGNPLKYENPISNYDSNYTFCGASPAIHDSLQKVIKNAVVE